MLKKLHELDVSKDSPFSNDALGRASSVEYLTSLIESTEQPFVLSIEAPWGWGKTTFIRMWKAHMESKGHTCFLFNAWQNDFVDDPLVAFIGEMAKHIEKEKEELNGKEPIKKYLAEVKRIGAGVLRKTLPLGVQVATHGLLNQETIKHAMGALSEESDKAAEFASSVAKERLEKYEAESKGIGSFRLNLEKLAHEIAVRKDGASPLVFFIDEMDRCRPDFAIALLERIKHLFNVPRVVFVLAVDRAQLNESVKALYGINTNSDGYLRRFIDLAYSLPAPSTELFVNNLFDRFTMGECINGQYADVWKQAFVLCASTFALSLRAQEQCFTEMNIVWRTSKNHGNVFPAVLSFYSAFRAFRPGVFEELRQKRISIDAAQDLLKTVNEPWYKVWFDAALIQGFCTDRDERQKHAEKVMEKLSNPESRYDYLFDPRTLAGDILKEGYTRSFLSVLSQLELATQFR